MEEEIWKDVPNYEGLYEVSSLGRCMNKHGRIKKAQPCNGYLKLILTKDFAHRKFGVHQLVAMAFLGHTPCGFNTVVNHIDHNRSNNNIRNLEVVTMRYNLFTRRKARESTSKYVGVRRTANKKKWAAYITIRGKFEYLGVFVNEEDASAAYNLIADILNDTPKSSAKSVQE